MSKTVLLVISVLVQSALPRFTQAMFNDLSTSLRHAPHVQGPTDPQELERFLDRVFNKMMREERIPGAAFVSVKGHEIFLKKAYGYADLDRKIPAQPDETLFRVGTVSKLFTATAVMQLAEQGKIDLTEDINKYLRAFR